MTCMLCMHLVSAAGTEETGSQTKPEGRCRAHHLQWVMANDSPMRDAHLTSL